MCVGLGGWVGGGGGGGWEGRENVWELSECETWSVNKKSSKNKIKKRRIRLERERCDCIWTNLRLPRGGWGCGEIFFFSLSLSHAAAEQTMQR